MEAQIFVAYCSPAGSTEHVAEVIATTWRALHARVSTLNVAGERRWDPFIESLSAAGDQACIVVGSPVYRDLAVPPVMAFIRALPPMAGGMAVPFITWGGATSGIALWQMGSALSARGYALLGAAKVLGVHSMMWGHEEPLGHGHPDAHDDRAVAGLAATLHHRLRTGNARPLALEVLDYQPPARAEDMKRKLSEPWKTTPKTLVTEKCTQCGICRDACPAAAIVMDPYPAVLRGCFDCFSCVRLCPENAWEPETCLPDLWAFIRKRAAVMKERPFTRVFL